MTTKTAPNGSIYSIATGRNGFPIATARKLARNEGFAVHCAAGRIWKSVNKKLGPRDGLTNYRIVKTKVEAVALINECIAYAEAR